MNILFSARRLERFCNGVAGNTPRKRKLKRRLDDLAAATCLEDMRNLPGRCHALHADRKGQLALDLDGPYRLIFEVADKPRPERKDGGLDWKRVRTIRLLEIEDYHG